jgi:hypothetical protein
MRLPHEDGILKEEAENEPAPTGEALRTGVLALAAFPRDQVSTYLNVLYLQDPERWSALSEIDAS